MLLPARFCLEFVSLETMASKHRQQIGKLAVLLPARFCLEFVSLETMVSRLQA